MQRPIELTIGISFALMVAFVVPASAGLVGYWPFDEGGGTIAFDATPNGNDGEISGATWTEGRLGEGSYALSFDGSSAYVDMGSNPTLDLTDAITVSAWVNSASAGQSGHIVNRGGGWDDPGYSLFWHDGRIRVELQRPGQKTTLDNSAPSSGDWHHLAFTWSADTGQMKTYFNGALQPNQATFTGSLGTPNQSLNVGYNERQGYSFNGAIDEVRIYDSALTQTQVAGLLVPESELGRHYVAQVDFGRGDVSPPDGWNRMDSRAGVTDMGEIPLRDPDGGLTPITLTVTDAFGWTWPQGPNQAITAPNGVEFPAATIVEFAGENDASGPRNNLAVIRMASVEKYFYELTFASANSVSGDLAVDTLVNLGGTWDAESKSFVGGETLTLDTRSYDTGFLSAWSEWDDQAAAYVLDLQVGNPIGGATAAGLNALHIRAVPEPTTWLVLMSALACGLLVRRRG